MTHNPLLEDLHRRQLIAQQSGTEDQLALHLNSANRVVYCGFDPTADSLHIGHLVPLLMLRRFQLAGHTPVALIGGATGMIGDPSFKATERPLNSPEQIRHWIDCIGNQLSHFLDMQCSNNPARIVNNADWIAQIDMLSFLRDIGKHFSVNAMIARESVKQRIARPDQGISFTEFSYSLLQAYDFAHLSQHQDCSIQIGGNDQWGNITSGIDLSRRMHGAQVYGITLPLITKSDGTKFGKTESGAIWLDPAKTSPYAFYQFWLNTADADVYRFLRYYTFLSEAEIQAIEHADQSSRGKPQAARILADQVTELVHGIEGVRQAQRISEALFSGEIQQLSEAELQQLEQDGMPSTSCQRGISIIDALIESGLAGSRRIAREHIAAGAVRLNGELISDENHPLSPGNALYGRYCLLKRGKKQFHLLRLETH